MRGVFAENQLLGIKQAAIVSQSCERPGSGSGEPCRTAFPAANFSGWVLGKLLDEMIEAEPDAPAVVIEGYGKEERGDEEAWENDLVAETEHDQKEDVDCQDDKLRRHDVDQDRPDKETRLAHKERGAGRAMVFDLKRALNN